MISCIDFLKNDLFYCEHLNVDTASKKEIIDSFSIKRPNAKGLEEYIKKKSFVDEEYGFARTFLVRDSKTKEIACFFTLKAGLVSSDEKITKNGIEFDSIPGIEISDFAVNDGYKERHPEVEHIGTIVFYCFIYKLALKISKCIGAYFLYIFALPDPDLISHYESLNFQKPPERELINKHSFFTPRYNRDCVFMCQKLVDN